LGSANFREEKLKRGLLVSPTKSEDYATPKDDDYWWKCGCTREAEPFLTLPMPFDN
jgi:hypothetical protein